MTQLRHFLFVSLTLLFSISNVQGADKVLYWGELKADFSSWGSDALAGDWRISQREGKYFIQLLDNFDAKKGPDVKIFLSQQAQADITGDNATDKAVFISLVRNFDGASEYEIPADINVKQFKTLVFHCEAYSKLWGSSKIQ